jgi:hypothetical protein
MSGMTAPYGPPGRLVVDTSYNGSAFLLAATGPKIEINGQPIKANWGPWPVDLPAGQYQVRVSTRYLGEMGPAQLAVNVYPGQQLTVFYRAPAAMFMAGAIGFTPQPTRGMGAMIALSVIALVLVFVMVMMLALG